MTDAPDAPSGRPRVVFGDDRSPGADVGWLWLNSQRWPGWELVVVTADPPPYGMPVPKEESVPHRSPDAPTRPLLAEAGWVAAEFLVARADPRVAIDEAGPAGMIAVGVASTRLNGPHLGSTTEWLLLNPSAPLLVARSSRTVRRALLCVDGSADSALAAATLASMPWRPGTAVTVLAVDDGRTAAEGALAAGSAPFAAVGHPVDTGIRKADKPHSAILLDAQDLDADLIVLGTRGLTPIRRLLLGSTASAVVRHAPCSVLVCRDRSQP